MPPNFVQPTSFYPGAIMLRFCLAVYASVAISLLGVALAEMPRVALSEQHRAMCRVGVGDTLPEMTLATPNGDEQKLAPLLGKEATVVVFYQSGEKLGWMTESLLADLGPDVAERFGKQGVSVIAISVGGEAKPSKDFLSLTDADGKALAKVGEGKLPRVYLVDAKGKILWFDIEYSHSTRRELRHSLATVVDVKAQAVARNEELGGRNAE